MCSNSELLKNYELFLKDLAEKHSPKVFTNGGGEFASILMGTMFDYTSSRARIFCTGFRPNLVMTDPYKSALLRFLDRSGTSLQVLVETDEYSNERPIRLLKERRKERGDDSIQIRRISGNARKRLLMELNSDRSNFSVFDNEKYRLEYDPENFKAIGSFNQPQSAGRLAALFDEAFDSATEI